jgi:hypothetical protein
METKPIYYSIRLAIDQKPSAVVLGLITMGSAIAIWFHSGTIAMIVGLIMILSTIAYIFLPVRLEINSNGIIKTMMGRKWLIRWSDIRSYQIQHNGLLLTTQQERYILDPFSAYFLPVPKGLMAEVLYRFRLFVGE